jgi:hypothetical protein
MPLVGSRAVAVQTEHEGEAAARIARARDPEEENHHWAREKTREAAASHHHFLPWTNRERSVSIFTTNWFIDVAEIFPM